MRHSEEIKQLSKALVAFQAECEPVVKDSVNPHFKSKFASLGAIREAVRPLLAKHKLCVTQGFEEACESGVLAVTTRLLHESGEWIESTISMPLDKKTPQGAGSAATYARRYALSAVLGIVSDDDDDAEGAMGRKAKRSTQEDDLPI